MPKEPTVFYTKPKLLVLRRILRLFVFLLLLNIIRGDLAELLAYFRGITGVVLGFVIIGMLYPLLQKPRPLLDLQEDGLRWYPYICWSKNSPCVYIPWQEIRQVRNLTGMAKWLQATSLPLEVVSLNTLLDAQPDKRAKKWIILFLGLNHNDTLWLELDTLPSVAPLVQSINDYLQQYRQQHPQ